MSHPTVDLALLGRSSLIDGIKLLDGAPDGWLLYPIKMLEVFKRLGIKVIYSKMCPDDIWAEPTVERIHDLWVAAGGFADLTFEEFLVKTLSAGSGTTSA